MREEETTLGDELELVRAYLGLQQTRMGARLDTTIDVPAELTGCRVPPMMLLTLVENAIKHGIAPLAEGGRIAINAERRGDALVLAVADNGRGLVGETGAGVGLANIRARLAALYGGRAELRLQSNAPRGVLAEIEVPSA
jgi:LytS/YehU family sensor histidine kinase